VGHIELSQRQQTSWLTDDALTLAPDTLHRQPGLALHLIKWHTDFRSWPIPELTQAWRILCHPDQRHTPRVSALFDFINGEIDALKRILTG
jgi:hypothetical protein